MLGQVEMLLLICLPLLMETAPGRLDDSQKREHLLKRDNVFNTYHK